VFPLPLGPKSAKNVPLGISNERPSNTRSPLYDLTILLKRIFLTNSSYPMLSTNINYYHVYFLQPALAIVIGTTTSANVHGTTTARIININTFPIDAYQFVKPCEIK